MPPHRPLHPLHLLTASLLSRMPVVQNKMRVLHALGVKREEPNKRTNVKHAFAPTS